MHMCTNREGERKRVRERVRERVRTREQAEGGAAAVALVE